MKVVLLLLCTVCVGCATHYRTEDAIALVQQPPDLIFDEDQVVLPLEVTNDGISYLVVTISGRELVLLVDTGIATFVLSSAAARQLSLEQIDLPPYWASGVGGTTKSSVALLPELVLGSARLTRLPIVIFDLEMWNRTEEAKGQRRIDGMLGSNVLVFLRASINFDTNTLILRKPIPSPQRNAMAQPVSVFEHPTQQGQAESGRVSRGSWRTVPFSISDSFA